MALHPGDPASSPDAAGHAWAEGRDGQHPVYRERLYPPIAIVVLAIALAAIVGVAYSAAYGATAGWLVGGTVAVTGVGVLVFTSPTIRVDDRVVRAGRARLPLTAIAGASALDAHGMREARRHGDPRDYLVLRPWSSRRGVAIDVNDSRDPHPRWVVTTRHPERLTAAIVAALAPHPPTPGPPPEAER